MQCAPTSATIPSVPPPCSADPNSGSRQPTFGSRTAEPSAPPLTLPLRGSLPSPRAGMVGVRGIRRPIGAGGRLMLEAEKLLRVVVQDLVGVGFGQPQTLDIGEGRFVGLVILQYRIVAARD